MFFNQPSNPDISVLRRVRALSSLSDNQLAVLANQLTLQKARRGEYLLRQHDTDPQDIYLVSGDIDLVARDGKKRRISVSDKDRIDAVAQLRPSMYDIVTRSRVDYLKIDPNHLRDFVDQSTADMGEISVHTLVGDQDDADSSITRSFFQHLMGGLYRLPQLPSAASRIQAVYRGKQTDQDKLIHILVSYPDLVRVLEKVSQVKVKEGSRITDRIRLTLKHLGIPSAYYLLMIYSIGSLIHRLPADDYQKILPWWEHCLEVSALSRMVAKKTSLLSPDLAMMAGLVHGIGAIALVDFLSQQDSLKPSDDSLQHTFVTMRAQISGLLLRKWNFGDNVILAAEECGMWGRKPDAPPDLCDLVLVANYFAALRDHRREQLPLTSEVPAFAKFQLDEKHGLELLQHTELVKNNIKKLFSRLEHM